MAVAAAITLLRSLLAREDLFRGGYVLASHYEFDDARLPLLALLCSAFAIVSYLKSGNSRLFIYFVVILIPWLLLNGHFENRSNFDAGEAFFDSLGQQMAIAILIVPAAILYGLGRSAISMWKSGLTKALLCVTIPNPKDRQQVALALQDVFEVKARSCPLWRARLWLYLQVLKSADLESVTYQIEKILVRLWRLLRAQFISVRRSPPKGATEDEEGAASLHGDPPVRRL
jgi:hypothetical protein